MNKSIHISSPQTGSQVDVTTLLTCGRPCAGAVGACLRARKASGDGYREDKEGGEACGDALRAKHVGGACEED